MPLPINRLKPGTIYWDRLAEHPVLITNVFAGKGKEATATGTYFNNTTGRHETCTVSAGQVEHLPKPRP